MDEPATPKVLRSEKLEITPLRDVYLGDTRPSYWSLSCHVFLTREGRRADHLSPLEMRLKVQRVNRAGLRYDCAVAKRSPITADPLKIFLTAEAFFNVCRTLQMSINQGNPMVLPLAMAVNSALALELYLQCLRTIEYGHFFKGHDFEEQYSDLTVTSRSEISLRHKEAEDALPIYAAMRSADHRTDLPSLLTKGRKVFEKFRYAFEEKANKDTLWGLDVLMLIVRDIIVENRLDWRPQEYEPFRCIK